MESQEATETTDDATEQDDVKQDEVQHDVVNEASSPFEGRWNRLISSTNWEKGQIIFEWRAALKKSEAPATEYSDEAWASRVGGVTGQHVGRLRRVYERFGETSKQYEGLYWSHFQAALDWDDAEMWLEGGIQNTWSVSQMRKARWEALGAPDDLKPKDEDIVSMELNEDLETSEDHKPQIAESTMENIDSPPIPEGPDFGDDADFEGPNPNASESEEPGANIYSEDADAVPFVRPFENLADLPEDVAGAFESFKLAIIRHKADDWQEFPREDMLGTLEALKELALAPASTDASF